MCHLYACTYLPINPPQAVYYCYLLCTRYQLCTGVAINRDGQSFHACMSWFGDGSYLRTRTYAYRKRNRYVRTRQVLLIVPVAYPWQATTAVTYCSYCSYFNIPLQHFSPYTADPRRKMACDFEEMCHPPPSLPEPGAYRQPYVIIVIVVPLRIDLCLCALLRRITYQY